MTRSRTLIVTQILDPLESDFRFIAPTRLVATEGAYSVEISGREYRERYQRRLESVRADWQGRLVNGGGRLVTCTTADPMIVVLRSILSASRGSKT